MPNPKDTATLEEFIEAGASVTISYDNLSLSDKIGNIRFPIYNIVNDYLNDLIALSVTVEFSLEEYNKYKYKPKLLASYLYGNPETFFIILMLNNICSIKDFDFKKLKLLSKQNMSDLIGNIYNTERTMLEAYNEKNEE